MLKVRARSKYKELWRYNLVMSCAGIDSQGDVAYVVGNKRVLSEDFYYRRGDITPLTPKDFVVGEPLDVECERTSKLRVLLYIIPYMFPADKQIVNHDPFEFLIEIFEENQLLFSKDFEVNCWSGASIDFTLDNEKVSE